MCCKINKNHPYKQKIIQVSCVADFHILGFYFANSRSLQNVTKSAVLLN